MKTEIKIFVLTLVLTLTAVYHVFAEENDIIYKWNFSAEDENISSQNGIYPTNFLHNIQYGENTVTVSNSQNQIPGRDTEAGFKSVISQRIENENSLVHLSFYITNNDLYNDKNAFIRYGRFKPDRIIPEIFDDCVITAAADGNFYSRINDKTTSMPYNINESYKIDCFADVLSGTRKVYVNGQLLAEGEGVSVTITEEYPSIEIEHIRFCYNVKSVNDSLYDVSNMSVSDMSCVLADRKKGNSYLIDKPVSLKLNEAESRAELKMFNAEATSPILIIASYAPDGTLNELKSDNTSLQYNDDGTVDYLSAYTYSGDKVKKAFVWNGETIIPIMAKCSTQSEFKAKLRIDNKIEFSWNCDISGGTVTIYTDDKKAAVANNPISEKSVIYDFIPNETEYSDFYTAVFTDKDGNEAESEIADTTAIMPRKSKKISTLVHPYMLATQDMVDNVKALTQTSAFYRRSVDNIISRADSYTEIYSDFSGTLEQNPIANYGPVFEAKNAISYCAMANLFEPKQEYVETAVKMFDVLGDSYEVNGYLMLQNKDDFLIIKPLCEAYDFLYNYLSEDERDRIENRYFRIAADRMINLERGRTRGGSNADIGIISIALLLQDQDLYDTGWYDKEKGYGFWYQVVNGLGDDSVWWEQSVGYHENKIDHWGELSEYYENAGYDFYNYCFTGNRDIEYDGADVAKRRNDNSRTYVNDLKYMNLIDGFIYRAGLNGWMPDFGDAEVDGNLWSAGYITYFERIYHYTHDERIAYLLSLFYGKDRGDSDPNSTKIIAHPRVLFIAEPNINVTSSSLSLKDGHFAYNAYNKFGTTVFGDLGEAAFRQKNDNKTSELWTQWCGYGTVSHSNADKLSIIWNINGEHALSDWGTYKYRTKMRYEYSKYTAAHNTVFADDRNQAPYNLADGGAYGEWLSDNNGEFTGGELNDISIGPVTRAISIQNDNCYNYLGIRMNRIIWQIDNYIIDIFNADSNRVHEYVYPLNINGTMDSISIPLKADENEQNAYGSVPGTMHIKRLSNSDKTASVWSSIWSIGSGNAQMKINMLGGDNTTVTTGFGIDDNDEEDIYNKPVILAKRKKKSTSFVNIMDSGGNNSFRKVLQLISPQNNGKKTYAAEIHSDNGINDTVLCSDEIYNRSVNGYETDAQSAFFRNDNGHETIVGCINGKKIIGKNISVESDKPISFQLTKTSDNCYRFDLGDKSISDIHISGLDDCKAYIRKSDNSWEEADISCLASLGGETFFIAPSVDDIEDCESNFEITHSSD